MKYAKGDHVHLKHFIGTVEILEVTGGRYYVLDRARDETYHLHEDDIGEIVPETVQV